MDTQSSMISAQDRLRESGIRVTSPRIIILDYLMNNLNHPTCEIIYNDVKKVNPTLSFASVYNVTEKLADSGLIRKIISPEGEYRFDGRIDYHGHFYCKKCKSIIDVNTGSEFRIEDLPGASIHSVSLTVNGICPSCN